MQWQHSIITGGGSGLGLGLAVRLLRRGTKVSILNRSLAEDSRRALDEAAQQGGGRWQFQSMDVADEDSVRDAVKTAVQAFGPVALAINSAGVAINKTFANTSCAEFRRVIDVNLNGSCHFAAAVLPQLKPGSRLVFIASIAGLTSNYGYSAYGTSKFGVVGLATTLRYEYEPLGIGITCVCPPEVKTPMVAAERTEGNADPISLGLKDMTGSLSIDAACDHILRGIDKGRWMVVSGVRGRMTAFLSRHFPAMFLRIMKFNVLRLMRKYPAARPVA